MQASCCIALQNERKVLLKTVHLASIVLVGRFFRFQADLGGKARRDAVKD